MLVTLSFTGVFAASAVTVSCSVCLLTLLKSVLRSECTTARSGNIGPLVIPCMVVVALCLVASAAYLVKSRAWSWSRAAALCSKWQPVYFVIVSVQRLILSAIVAHAVGAVSRRAGPCAEYENLVHAASLMWLCAVVLTSLSTMCCDLEAALSPALRRCAYGVLALVLVLDAIGSVVWGNLLASDVSLFISSISVLLENQLTSCIASQAAIALHFAYVSCRSRRGRGWAYASLRFELDECGKSSPIGSAVIDSRTDSSPAASAATPLTTAESSAPVELQRVSAARSNVFSRSRQRWLQWQRRQIARCRVFVIPCVAARCGGSGVALALARPAFGFKMLLPLQHLADAHPRYYSCFMFLFLGLPSAAVAIVFSGQTRGIYNLVLNSILCTMMVAFLSTHRYGLDRVAVKHVASSFRFAIFVTLLAADVGLNIRKVYTGNTHPVTVVSIAMAWILFCLCIMLDCCPHMPSSVQMLTSVSARKLRL
jgi:hypothetical protein